ncbi:serine/threonine protein phosphatase [Phormidesmis priestleyi ULC007]|uniref:Serine/threonine protein phosphatase n=1 Tax=Phormidesmis priestleyi ULC007 TaxID=1920490 RepID=A0A2T1DNS2_9CYAN|nr:protein phosphatase 2C domain-containing protein [Phormidesmis priestleyi]PSB22111.1 serine/threonine protein phosphatase [Phormidesmis priestleyi ULC007]PZO54921.1 MAG: serine/threonine protein phosphatase [Phormidesmis priestleyi]
MQNDPPILQCSNFFCQALNSESHQFCHKCRSPLIKRYLWAVGSGLEIFKPRELVGDRYLLKTGQVLLDTKPGFPPESPVEIPVSWEVYLRLSPSRLHVPQIYGMVTAPRSTSTLLLLEDAAIYPDGAKLKSGNELAGSLMPKLTSLWTESDPLRQLNWLWQIAQLWEPFCRENVASTLLTSDLLRVDASFVRLLDLQPDTQGTPDLTQLGQFWAQWQQNPADPISDFLTQLCQQMIQGQIRTADQLLDRLDQGMTHYGQGQTRTIQIATFTDQGPSRQSNEDACYPASGSHLSFKIGDAASNPVVIVCDGIGGHEGGEVASGLAIATLQTQAETLLSETDPDAATLVSGLEQAALSANDVISQRNDQEHRQERQRMGTTVVMALAHAHELLINHVGDSRAYRITRTGCYQVTLDDDVASREVRLGYALYRNALQQPSSGALVQALGMSSSNFLHPTVQRFVLDEDCVFLLCSDGLSDHDRVDECWEEEIVPILDGTTALATASRRLVEIANTRNGHDNVTVGLVYCQVTLNQTAIAPLQIDWDRATSQSSEPSSLSPRSRSAESLEELPSEPSTLKTQIIQRPRSSFRFLPLLVMLLALFGIGGLLVLLVPEIRVALNPVSLPPTSSFPTPIPTVSLSPDPPTPFNSTSSALEARMVILLDRPTTGSPQPPVLFSLVRQPNAVVPPASDQTIGSVVPGTIARVVNQQATEDRISWVRLEVCSVPGGSKVANAVKPGDFGWQEERTVGPFVTQNLSLKPAQLGRCAPPAASASPAPTP